MFTDYLHSPLGDIQVQATNLGICKVAFVNQRDTEVLANNHTTQCCKELTDYFAGTLDIFTVPVDSSGTEFQHKVWQSLMAIPYGQTCSYGDIAERINNPKAVRAVGLANGKNPVAILVPCHRVIGKNGTLTGYAGGLERKKALLKLEGAPY